MTTTACLALEAGGTLVAASTAIVFLYLMILLRVLGRTMLAELSVIDLLVMLTLGSAVETSMVRADTSLRAGLISASVILLLNRLLVATVGRSKRVRHALGLGPLLLVHNGHIQKQQLRRAGLRVEDLLEAVRERGYASLDNIRWAIMEQDGEINVIERKATQQLDPEPRKGDG
jgi:uncharacterized membrane protein YcaP (DUF421 family)